LGEENASFHSSEKEKKGKKEKGGGALGRGRLEETGIRARARSKNYSFLPSKHGKRERRERGEKKSRLGEVKERSTYSFYLKSKKMQHPLSSGKEKGKRKTEEELWFQLADATSESCSKRTKEGGKRKEGKLQGVGEDDAARVPQLSRAGETVPPALIVGGGKRGEKRDPKKRGEKMGRLPSLPVTRALKEEGG